VLHALDSQQAIDLLISRLRKTKTNIEFLMQVSKTALGSKRRRLISPNVKRPAPVPRGGPFSVVLLVRDGGRGPAAVVGEVNWSRCRGRSRRSRWWRKKPPLPSAMPTWPYALMFQYTNEPSGGVPLVCFGLAPFQCAFAEAQTPVVP